MKAPDRESCPLKVFILEGKKANVPTKGDLVGGYLQRERAEPGVGVSPAGRFEAEISPASPGWKTPGAPSGFLGSHRELAIALTAEQFLVEDPELLQYLAKRKRGSVSSPLERRAWVQMD
jgi:hypothetical protein